MCLAEACDTWGFAYVAAPIAAKHAELSERHFYRIARELADAGLITTFQARGLDGRLHNLYRLNFYPPAPAAGVPLPEGHPSANPKYTYKCGVENLDEAVALLASQSLSEPPDTMSPGQVTNGAEPPDTMSPGSEEPPDNGGQAIGQMEPSQVTPESYKPETYDKNLETRAREADRPDGSASRDASEEKPTPANAHFRERMPQLEAYFRSELAQFRHWMLDCTPDSDDGKTIVFAVPGSFFTDQIRRRYGRGLQTVLEREIEFVVTDWAGAKRAKRVLGDTADND